MDRVEDDLARVGDDDAESLSDEKGEIMPKWKYILHPVSIADTEAIGQSVGSGLNGMGQHGWEAVAWIPKAGEPSEGYVLLKMPISN